MDSASSSGCFAGVSESVRHGDRYGVLWDGRAAGVAVLSVAPSNVAKCATSWAWSPASAVRDADLRCAAVAQLVVGGFGSCDDWSQRVEARGVGWTDGAIGFGAGPLLW